ncbi:hypothetical protein RRG08_009650 [Elysia crispata]|uniref:Uncharacterized protein n=1 Tax=Elysia crispata TaxID=231223 RepID=A0AAE0ZWC3_9GAST|nr:hypothetical protein RRG08_009650 [Elysia crispata]
MICMYSILALSFLNTVKDRDWSSEENQQFHLSDIDHKRVNSSAVLKSKTDHRDRTASEIRRVSTFDIEFVVNRNNMFVCYMYQALYENFLYYV